MKSIIFTAHCTFDRMYSRSFMKMEILRNGWKGKNMPEIREALRT